MNDFFIGLELTRHCNLRCAHCFRADLDQVEEIPFATVEKVLEQGKRYHRPHIALTGGEPTLHSRFYEILDLIVSHNYSFHYVTNGFNYASVFRRLFPLFENPLWVGVSVSLDGASSEVHDSIRGKGSFSRALATIAIARTHKREVVVQMVVHRGNRKDLEPMAVLCSKMDVNRLHVAHMQPTPHAVEAGLMSSPDECRQIENEVSDLQGRFRMPIVLSAGFYDQTPLAHCRFLKLGALNIDFRGRLTTCCQLSNLEGARGERDIVADLKTEDLASAHVKLLKKYQERFEQRLTQVGRGELPDIDNFHCWSCMKHFGQVDWMGDYPDNEWVRTDPYFNSKR